jgi:predicted PurR-regulated permease PerM
MADTLALHNPPTRSVADPPLEAAALRSEHAWQRLGLRLRAISPAHLARMFLVTAALAAVAWLIASTWSELLPFQFGIALAYITLPVSNRLARVMPAWMAAAVVVALELTFVVGFVALLIPTLISELTQLIDALPDPGELQERIAALRAQLQTLPEPTRDLVRNGVEQLTAHVRGNLLGLVQGALPVVVSSLFGLFNTLGFVIALLGIPTWLIAVLSDQKAGTRVINRMLPVPARADFWAVVRIADRTFGTFVRGQFILAIAVTLMTYLGLSVMPRLGFEGVHSQLILALFAGVAQLIPAVGPILGAIPAVGMGLTISPGTGLAILALYVGVQFALNTFVTPHVERRYNDLSSAVFVIVLVVLSQFGFFWLLVAAPLAIVVRDLFLYAHGRLSEPARPAGVLPGTPVPAPTGIRSVRGRSSEVALRG